MNEKCITEACALGDLTPAGPVVWIVVEPVGGGALPEEVSRCTGVGDHSCVPFPVGPFCFLYPSKM